MPINFFRPNQLQLDIMDIGKLTLGNGTVGVLQDAFRVAADLKPSLQGPAFTNEVISDMAIDPTFKVAEVAAMSDLQIGAIVPPAAELLGLDAEVAELWDQYSTRNVLFEAYSQHLAQVYESYLQPMQERIDEMLGITAVGSASVALAQLSLDPDLIGSISTGVTVMDGIRANLLGLGVNDDYRLFIEPGVSTTATAAMALALGEHSLEDLTSQLIATNIPEPLLTRSMIETDLASSFIHTPAYELPIFDPIETEADLEEEATALKSRRRADLQDTLTEVETKLRLLITTKLGEIAGSNWWKQRVPEQIRKDCRERQMKRQTPYSLRYAEIEFSYIGDLASIICRRDNWREVFSDVFENQNEFETVSGWLGVVRTDLAHSRESTDQEYQQFIVAANWMLLRISRHLVST